MKRFLIWLLLEYKRAVKILPFVLAEAMVLIVFIGTIAFCAQKAEADKSKTDKKSVIALVIQEDSALMDMAVSYVESMESIESFCRFEHVDLEKGKRMLKNGEAIAVIELPVTLVEGILNGENQPATLYMPKDISAAGQILEVLTDAGISMLQIAQAEIYAANDISVTYAGRNSISDMEYDINIFNINLAFYREELFKMRSVSLTENLPVVNYYCAAGMVLYLLLAGLSFCTYFEKANEDCEKQLRCYGVGIPLQVLGKISVVSFFLLVSAIIPGVALVVLSKLGIVKFYLDGWAFAGGILCIISTAVILTGIYRLLGSTKAALLCIGILSLVLCFLSGVFLPSSLLPETMRMIAEYLPTTWMKQLWADWFVSDGFAAGAFAKLLTGTIAGFGGLNLILLWPFYRKGAVRK